jgi:hypothetical protein
MPTAITYQSGPHKRDLRTVICSDVRESVVLLPSGRLDVMVGKLLEGTASRHVWWAEILGTDTDDHEFICPTDQVVARREISVAAIVKSRKGARPDVQRPAREGLS